MFIVKATISHSFYLKGPSNINKRSIVRLFMQTPPVNMTLLVNFSLNFPFKEHIHMYLGKFANFCPNVSAMVL